MAKHLGHWDRDDTKDEWAPSSHTQITRGVMRVLLLPFFPWVVMSASLLIGFTVDGGFLPIHRLPFHFAECFLCWTEAFFIWHIISFIFAFLVSGAVTRTEQGLNRCASYVEIACIKWNTVSHVLKQFSLRALKIQSQIWFPSLIILLWNSTSISNSIPLRILSWKLKATGEFPFQPILFYK